MNKLHSLPYALITSNSWMVLLVYTCKMNTETCITLTVETVSGNTVTECTYNHYNDAANHKITINNRSYNLPPRLNVDDTFHFSSYCK
jgi:hypothetical protein